MERCKKVKERRKPKDIGHYSISFKNSQNVDFCTCLSKNVIKCGASGNKGRHHIAKAFFGPFPSWKSPKCPKNVFLARSSRRQWINYKNCQLFYANRKLIKFGLVRMTGQQQNWWWSWQTSGLFQYISFLG